MHNDLFESISQRGDKEKLRKIEESLKSPMNSVDAANYMKNNFEKAKKMQDSTAKKSPYAPEFVKKIERSRASKGKKINLEDLWTSVRGHY